MKNYIFRLCLAVFVILFASIIAMAQAVTETGPFDPGTTPDKIFTWYTGAYGALITLVTYVQGAFFKNAPWANKINTGAKFLLISVVTAALFLSFNWATAISLFIGFIGAALTYDKVLLPLGLKTPSKKANNQ
jgi:hypothetical protein